MDDVYSIIVSTKDAMINKIVKFITSMNHYFRCNKLKNNLSKSKFMIYSDSKILKTRIIMLEGVPIENSAEI